jgi:glycosyl transferase, family 25
MISKYVINLDHRTDRYASFVSSCNQNSLESSEIFRISASYEPDFGGLGCAKSHLRTLTHFLTCSSNQHCAIFEDDFSWNNDVSLLNSEFKIFVKNIPNYNVFLLSGAHVIKGEAITHLSDHYEIFESSTASGYIVNRNYIPVLINIFSNSILMMEKYKKVNERELIYSRFAIDQVWKSEQRKGNWFAKIPMHGKQCPSYSDIEKRIVDYAKESS